MSVAALAKTRFHQLIGCVRYPDKPQLTYYCGDANFGDELGRYLFEAIINSPVRRTLRRSKPHAMFLGSILGSANNQTTVYGSGFITSAETSTPKAVFFVRGAHSLANLNKTRNDLLRVPLGDAAWTLTNKSLRQSFERLYYTKKTKQHCTIILHHQSFRNLFTSTQTVFQYGGKLFYSTLHPWSELYSLILNSQSIVSDALHPLVVADVYGIKSTRLRFLNMPLIGGEFKFDDYSSAGQSDDRPVIEVGNNFFEEIGDLVNTSVRNGGAVLPNAGAEDLCGLIQDTFLRL